jgi:CBS domain containing-hemolysin-like protein
MEVKEVVKPAVVIDENATFVDALAAMDNGKSNTLLVTNERGKLSGEVTVTDLLGAIVPDTLNGDEVMEHFGDDEAFMASIELVKDLPVASFMTSDFTALKLEDNLLTIIATAIAHQRARIPVVDHNDHPIGIISRQGLKRIIQKYLR